MQPSTDASLASVLKLANWIWNTDFVFDPYNSYVLFRQSFRLERVPRRAPLFITADQSYQLYINGHYICRGPARGFQKQWPCDEVNLSPWLQEGDNLIAIRAYNPGVSNFQYICQGSHGLLVAGKWGKTVLASNSGWKSRRQCGVARGMVPTSMQLFPQENIDLRHEDPDWYLPDYDDSHWTGHTIVNTWNCMPWYSLEPRGLPMLDESIVETGTLIGKAEGACGEDYVHTGDLARHRFAEGLAHQPASGSATEMKIPASGNGRFRSVLIDMGKLYVGATLLTITGARGGEIVETHHYETIDQTSLTPDYDPDAHCKMGFSRRLTCRPGDNSHRFYHTFGSRYMVLTVRDSQGPLTIRQQLAQTLYPLQEKGRFQSSDEALNGIWQTCAWTQRVCSLDAYVDTPHREQAQWWGDARVQAWNTFHLDGDARLLRRGIRQIATQTTPDGVTYGHAPTIAHSCVLPDFTLVWILTLWDYYWQTGSLEAFLEHQDTLEKALRYFESVTDPKTGMLIYDRRFWLFLDWTALPKDGCSSVFSLWYLHALDRLAQMHTLAGQPELAAARQKTARALRRSLRKLIGDDGLMRDGYDPKGKMHTSTSVHAQTLALITDLAPRSRRRMLDTLLAYLHGELKTDIRPSSYWITYLYTELSNAGYGADVIDHIRQYWMPMTDYGTAWENFQPRRGHESFSHAWSAHPLFHLMQIIGGVRQSAPQWEEISIRPDFLGDSADVAVPSPHGLIQVKWKRAGEGIQGSVTVPSGVSATLQLPGQKAVPVEGRQDFICARQDPS